jgi:tRNA (adenine37-N6)-methyltransferase
VEIKLKQIGTIHTPYTEKGKTPIQGCFAPDSEGYIEVFPEYAEGLSDIQGFSHLILIYYFHEAKGFNLMTKPFLDKDKKGVFATRYFERPNAIGLSVVKLVKVNGSTINICQVDMLDGTPLLDIKPYVSQFDIKRNTKCGWYKNASERTNSTVIKRD